MRIRSRLLGLNSRKLNLWDDVSVHIFLIRSEGKHTHTMAIRRENLTFLGPGE